MSEILLLSKESPENLAFSNIVSKNGGSWANPQKPKDILTAIKDKKKPMMLIMEDQVLWGFKSTLIKLVKNHPNWTVVVLTSDSSNDQNLDVLQTSGGVWHLLHRNNKDVVTDFETIIKNYLSEKETRFMSHLETLMSDLFPCHHLFATESNQRWDFFNKIGDFVSSLDAFSEFSNIVQTAASELVTNAFYNAPRDKKTGKARFPDRSKNVSINPPDTVEIIYGVKDSHLWLFVKDPFGSFNCKAFCKALVRATKERTAIIDSEGGAGLGLFMLTEWSTRVVVAIDSGKSTTVGCKLLITRRSRLFDSESASLHFFESKAQK